MTDSTNDNLKLDLECLRLASDCVQLANEVLSGELQQHLIGMARHWTARAEGGAPAGTTLQ
jgi:hypothetical protein